MKLSLRRRSASRARPGRARRGTTTVEFAIVCPILFTFFFAAVEFGRANQILNATSNAAYQGCRAAIIPGGTAAMAISAANATLSAGLISGATVTVNPSTITNSTTSITVTVVVPLNSNTWVTQFFTLGKSVTRACTLTREKTN